MSETRYSLTPNTYICQTAFHWVLLDIIQDRYFTLGKKEFGQLGPYIRGWLEYSGPGTVQARTLDEFPVDLANELLRAGTLTSESAFGKPMRRTALEPPTTCISALQEPMNVAAWVAFSLSFFRSAAKADRLLRRSHISQIVRSVSDRNAQRGQHFDFRKAGRLIHAFTILRPSYPRDYLCLFDSLALLEFLSAYRLFPTWVFGVSSDPFAAHCWVQQDGVALNDTIERISTYVPIMTV